MVEIKPRSAWGAKSPTAPPSGWAVGGPIDLVVHWVGGTGSLGLLVPAQVPSAIRSVQTYEMSHGYSDIAYNLILDPFGAVWEGRGLQVAGAANGAQTNSTKPSVCLLLNQNDRFTAAMQESLQALIRSNVRGSLYAHREVNSTACPGDAVAAWVIHERTTPPAPTPTPTPTPTMEEDMMLMRGDKTPHVWIVNGPWKTHITAAAYPGWLFTCAGRPGALSATGKEHVVPQAMIDAIPDTKGALK